VPAALADTSDPHCFHTQPCGALAEVPVRVLTVDDQAGFRAIAREVIGATPGFTAVGEAPDGSAALEATRRLEPDLVIVDVCMPGMNGFEVARRVREADPDTVVLLVSANDLAEGAVAAEACGACAFMPKEDVRPSALSGLWRAHGREI
jgi:DNA-binding NarL/FixJ family response regulator